MPEEPQIKVLSKGRRNLLFILMVIVFLVALPSMIFYTTGYRLNFDNDETSIVTTGGLYITTDNLEVDVYLDDEQIDKPRLFRSAYYIQNIETGKHRIVVQREGLQTWVKELFVDSRMVAEAAAFNMPLVTQLRPITKYLTVDDEPVYFGVSSSTKLFGDATSTIPFVATTSRATSTFFINEEFDYVESLFSSTSTSTNSVFQDFMKEANLFGFATTTDGSTTSGEVNYIEKGDIRLVERGGEIYAVWTNGINDIPHYFCVPDGLGSTTAERYGEHVAESIVELVKSTTTPLIFESDRICRPEIKLNRLNQDVFYYDFMPNGSDLVLLGLEDGLYVTEIDDRAWQNTQQIYNDSDFIVVIENNIIYILDDGRYFELVTEIESN